MYTLDLANIQGNILRGYRFAVSSYLFLRIEDPNRMRAWLADFTPHVTNSEPWQSKPGSTVNIAFSYAGLKALGLPAAALSSFSVEFQQGMAQRAALLGDTDESAPERWEGPFGSGDVHVLVAFNALHPAALAERRAWFQELLDRRGGLKLIAVQEGALLPQGGEHFGYLDGIGQPSVAGAPNPALPGQGTPQKDGSWKPLNAGEFVFGYPDEEGLLPDAPQPDLLGRNGTYLVFRKLHQKVGLFRQFLREQAAIFPGGEELLAAKLVGRWRDGTPLAASPERMNPDLVRDENRNNDFRYGDDPNGLRCPIGAHVRRANPRDDGLGKISNRHRIIRRGVTYGPVLPPGADEDGQDRGVVFMAINSNIGRQFEFVQSQWINDGNIFGLGGEKDLISGDHNGKGKMTVQGRPPCFLAPLPRFVTVRGGDYFFMPGINALRWMANPQSDIPLPPPAESTKPEGQMTFLEEIEALPKRFADDLSRLKQAVLGTLEQHLKEHPEPLFALLREVKPILVTHGLAIVTRFEDVIEVLDHPAEFNVPYAPKMQAITGDFILGLDNNAQYEHDVSALRLAVRRDDLERVATLVTRMAEEIVQAAAPSGQIDVVSDLTQRVPARLIAAYLGIPGPDEETLIEWAHLIFDDLFNNVKNDPAITNMALAAGQEMRSYLDRLIAERKAEMARDGARRDDVLERLLLMQRVPGLAFDDAGVRNNLIGLITGWIPTVSKSTSMALNNLLDRPEELAAAQEAARQGNVERVKATMFEAMRFAPQNPGLLRHCAVDYTLAKGTHRATLIPAGTTVFASTQSAMLDGHVIDDPKTFRLDRPSSHYLHFGWGLHTCFGQYLNAVQIPLIAKALLSQSGLKRASGEAGALAFQGNFPSSLMVVLGSSNAP